MGGDFFFIFVLLFGFFPPYILVCEYGYSHIAG